MKPTYEVEAAEAAPIEPPPLLGTWRRLYTFVILSQVVFVILLWLLSESV